MDKFIDSHAHTYLLNDDELRKAINSKTLILNNGTNIETNKLVLKSPFLKAIGWWPLENNNEKVVENLVKNNEIHAIGEIGLDFFRVLNKTKQIKNFEFMLDLAKEFDLPVSVHSRKAESEVLKILENLDIQKVMLHSFQGRKSLIKKAVSLNYSFSVPCNILRDSGFQNLVKMVPLKQLLTESDSPYLPIIKGERSNPSDVKNTVKVIESLKNCDNVKKIIFENFNKLIKS